MSEISLDVWEATGTRRVSEQTLAAQRTHAFLAFVALADVLIGLVLVLVSSARSPPVPITP